MKSTRKKTTTLSLKYVCQLMLFLSINRHPSKEEQQVLTQKLELNQTKVSSHAAIMDAQNSYCQWL